MTIRQQLRVTFIGGGNMAAALINGLVGRFTPAAYISVIDVNPQTLQQLSQQFGVTVDCSVANAVADCDILILAVKPQQMTPVLQDVAALLQHQLVISIAAGIRTAELSAGLLGYTAIVRAMPNMPALIGRGMTGMFAMPGASAEQQLHADTIMGSVGKTLWLKAEQSLDAVTGVSGSGPAFVFYFIEALQKAALEVGLNATESKLLALETVAGAAQLALQSDDEVALLRERVTSKGGTTFAGLNRLQQDDFCAVIARAVKAATNRSKELGDTS
ncbi:MAG: Pyrroline-5-carboxylate reductase [Collimonas fungivorans]|uniref:pyrroline-5-carboxylate reductase n=1 Tax=Collimonas fungivorans TaxID=158899 RepID=UPI0026EFA1AE|nr:pyrroline-5-carboxylate reductase [Collimonas fungivorans]MDB5768500.1 Pyrroline-5-carboxylate reductase [Collimonas fungivorans]